jgi:phosphoglycolate phosphatase-like HAD superfamily hydrolase
VSRYEKIRVYLDWVGQSQTAARVDQFCERFGELVMQAVIDCDWVPGVRAYLLRHHAQQAFVLVTAAPQDETRRILQALQATHWFREVHGTPTTKTQCIQSCLQRYGISARDALVVGDSESDLTAARANGVPFLLRRTPLNVSVQRIYSGPVFDDLSDT